MGGIDLTLLGTVPLVVTVIFALWLGRQVRSAGETFRGTATAPPTETRWARAPVLFFAATSFLLGAVVALTHGDFAIGVIAAIFGVVAGLLTWREIDRVRAALT